MNALTPAQPRALAGSPGSWLLEVLSPLVRAFDALADGSWKKMVLAAGSWAAEPAFALEEHEDRYVLKALIPGASPASLTVVAAAGRLRLSGCNQLRFSDGKSFGYVREQPLDEEFTLPPDADGEHIQSRLAPSGLLLVTIPRHRCLAVTAEPAAEPAAEP